MTRGALTFRGPPPPLAGRGPTRHRTAPRRPASARRPTGPAGRGFSLVEVVVATLVLTIAALILTSALVMDSRANATARERSAALAAAQDQIERILADPAPSSVSILAFSGLAFLVPGLTPPSTGALAGAVTVDPTELPLVTIQVRVSWIGLAGPDQITLKTTILTLVGGP